MIVQDKKGDKWSVLLDLILRWKLFAIKVWWGLHVYNRKHADDIASWKLLEQVKPRMVESSKGWREA